MSLDIFNRHADTVVMTNIAQTINVLQAMILTDGPDMVLTPTYHVYDLYSDHQGGDSIRTLVSGPSIATEKGKVPQISGSASVKGSTLTVTLVNASATEATETTVHLLGGSLKSVIQTTGLEFPAGDIHAHNTVENPTAVTLAEQSLVSSLDAMSLVVNLPPASVTKLTLEV